jgi:hypothetical protein
MCRIFLIWCSTICQCLLLFPGQLVCYQKKITNAYILQRIFFHNSLKVSGLILRTFTHLELNFVQGERQGSCFSLLHVDNQLFQYHLLKRLSFLQCMFSGSFVKDQMTVLCGFISGSLFYSIGFHVFFVPISCCFCHYGSLVSFQIQYCDNSSIAVFAQDYFFYSGSFMLHINFSKLTFLFLQRMTSEFSWAWHWICRLLSAVYPFSWYEFWQSMSRGSLSISGVFNIFPQDFTVFIVLFHFLG